MGTASEPRIVKRAAQPYVGIVSHVEMSRMAEMLVPATNDVVGWMAAHGVAASGPPIWKYNRIDMAGEMEIEVGFPVAGAVPVDGQVHCGELPAGRYALVVHVGHPDDLRAATGELLSWAEQEGVAWDVDGDRWTARLEEYLDDPVDEPDMTKWTTNLLFKIADPPARSAD